MSTTLHITASRQFDPDGPDGVIAGLPTVIQTLEVSPMAKISWLTRPNQMFDGQIVAELSFGFWTTHLSQPYHQRLWAPNNAALLRAAFPNLPPTPNARRHIHARYNNLRLLRNRVMHHEPIWQRSNLLQDHQDAIEAIGWISQTTRDTVAQLDSFPDEFANGQSGIESAIKQMLGIP